MKVDDYYFYKKNTIAKHMLSKELSRHREAVKKEHLKSLNDFVLPILSAVIALYIAYYSKSFSIKTAIYIIVAYLVVYYSGFLIVKYLIVKVIDFGKKLRIKSYSRNKMDERINIFNNEVVNQVYLSYSLYSCIENSQTEKYYIFESLFNAEQALDTLNDIFNKDTIKWFNEINYSNVHAYRVEMVFELLEKTYQGLKGQDLSEINNDLMNFKTSYNHLKDILSAIPKINRIE